MTELALWFVVVFFTAWYWMRLQELKGLIISMNLENECLKQENEGQWELIQKCCKDIGKMKREKNKDE